MSLNDICYEQIKDSFYYGLFGDFKLIIDKNTGYFNATKLCKDGGKRFKKWLENDRSKELIECFDKDFGSPNSDHQKSTYIIESKGTNKLDLLISGTYVCDDLLLSISTWISTDFYKKCNKIIKHYFISDFKSKYENDNEQLQYKLKQLEKIHSGEISEKNETIKDREDRISFLIKQNAKIIENHKVLETKYNEVIYMARKQETILEDAQEGIDDLKFELEDTNDKLENLTEKVERVILPDRNISPSEIDLRHNIAIYKSGDSIKIIRAQNRSAKNKLKNIPSKDIIINEYVPNPIDFVNRMKTKTREINKNIKNKLRKENNNMSIMEFDKLYENKKSIDIKYIDIVLNNSRVRDLIDLFENLKKEQYNY
ncbi:N1R/p28-like protein [Mythimna separata entomopoxvirus 'L']|uniref:N1R/p28-like protein n=1 Tax=Mythimna separata entomopoxvirus 'L' TaxID=1293572 RepID=A0A916P297_9POXV|nr:N1R/p28-like protein [Mythimna separata entomopoxvirus 'L']YP_008003819.1 N1R/p28-like protein [Mythimna separata entomopoxvirus 'L']CCU56203.1 N1R/p28-like protein [Mythimna separata entomopoxvirus 'L']CCU56500.1 N1R/p28-like protein [Mythimna separata entomopoxvirus 'L']